jgi:transcription elongation factor Elf1
VNYSLIPFWQVMNLKCDHCGTKTDVKYRIKENNRGGKNLCTICAETFKTTAVNNWQNLSKNFPINVVRLQNINS